LPAPCGEQRPVARKADDPVAARIGGIHGAVAGDGHPGYDADGTGQRQVAADVEAVVFLDDGGLIERSAGRRRGRCV
jgi:hypothetical protein